MTLLLILKQVVRSLVLLILDSLLHCHYTVFCLPALPSPMCTTVRDWEEERCLAPYLLLSSALEKQCLVQAPQCEKTMTR